MFDDAKFPIPPVDDRLIYDLTCSNVIAPVITVSQEIQLFSILDARPQTIEEVADNLNILPTVSETLIAVLAAFGLLARQRDGCFSLTELATTYMLPESPFFYTGLCPEQDWNLKFLRIKVRSGNADPPAPLNVQMFQHPLSLVESYTRRMQMGTLPAAAQLANHPVFRLRSQLLDIGGGSGSLAIAIAACNPNIRCTIMDLDPVCSIATNNIEKYGLQNRVNFLAQDMFADTWPTGYDSILFGNIFHGWDLETCYLLAQCAFNSLKPGGKILLHEMPLNETKDGPLTVACVSVIMLMHERGKQYTLKELEQTLCKAGFVNFHSTPTHVYHHLIIATKPELSVRSVSSS